MKNDLTLAREWLSSCDFDELATKSAFEQHAKSLAEAFARSRRPFGPDLVELLEAVRATLVGVDLDDGSATYAITEVRLSRLKRAYEAVKP